jgi:hypothetical protein
VPSATCPQTQVSTYYERQPAFGFPERGGGIFAAGTVQWSWGLDGMFSGEAPDPRLELLTSNLLRGLSERLVVPDSGIAVVRVAFAGAPPADPVDLTAQASHVGRDETALDPFALADDGAWPDSAAGDGIWSGTFPLPAGLRLPLRLAFQAGGRAVCTSRLRDYFWLGDTERADSVYMRNLDTLLVCDSLVAVPAQAAAPRPPRVVPNPFRSTIRLAWDASNPVLGLTIHDVRGRLVEALVVPRGAPAVVWDGRDRSGRPVPAGVYYARARTARGFCSLRLVRLR